MTLEERIKQNKPFGSERERLVVNILYTTAWINEVMRGHYEEFDITGQQYNVLRILRGQHPNAISTIDIKERMLDKSPDTSRIVDRLLQKGLVEKGSCKEDRRKVDVRISKKGLALLQEIDADRERAQRLMQGLSNDEAQTLNTLLDKLKDGYKETT